MNPTTEEAKRFFEKRGFWIASVTNAHDLYHVETDRPAEAAVKYLADTDSSRPDMDFVQVDKPGGRIERCQRLIRSTRDALMRRSHWP